MVRLLSWPALLGGLILTLPCPSPAGEGRWTTQGPFGADVEVLLAVADGPRTLLWAGTLGGGVWSSADRGASWAPAHGGLANVRVLDLAAPTGRPQVLYAALEGGVFRTADGGGTWSAVSDGLPTGDGTPTVVTVDPSAPARLYAGSPTAGVFRSTNGGQSWQPANAGLDDLRISALAVDPTDPATVWAGTGSGLRRSRDRGAS